MTYKTAMMIDQDEYTYYAYAPEWDGGEIESDSLDDVLPRIWQAVAHYLETITEEESVAALY
ncbi:MAG: type II toxin-antitoxin system HicB family antitoxin [Anaerolineae bacterium]|nr:type II toxin-antitoxin system HicB family antitoxin [Anaerolineae bacterium]